MNFHSKEPRHIIEAQQFDLADALRNGRDSCMAGKILTALFYEPSTRTRHSFEAAMMRLGGEKLSTENAKDFSSAVKGERVEDTIRIESAWSDVIVLRHYEDDAALRAARVSCVPVINAGCGKGQHPTQALLDLYTIKRERGGIDGTTIAVLGDLKYGRTVRSLCYLLGKFKSIRIFFVSPPSLRIGRDILEYLGEKSISYLEVDSLEHIIGRVDVIYTTRIQKERMEGLASGPEFLRLQHSYRIDAAAASKMQHGAIIMHPLPRNDELAFDVDDLPQAAYFRQSDNGLYVRMALLKWMFMK
jgi:aspartate carbamoyltransferase catalytic subunit